MCALTRLSARQLLAVMLRPGAGDAHGDGPQGKACAATFPPAFVNAGSEQELDLVGPSHCWLLAACCAAGTLNRLATALRMIGIKS